MGLLHSLFGGSSSERKLKPIHDEFFGELLHSRDSTYSTRRVFKPSDKEISMAIECGPTGPTQVQKDFYHYIENNYAAIVQSIVPLMEQELSKGRGNFRIYDFQKEFRPLDIVLPDCTQMPVEWDIMFETDHNRDNDYIVIMNNFEAQSVRVF